MLSLIEMLPAVFEVFSSVLRNDADWTDSRNSHQPQRPLVDLIVNIEH